MPLQTIGFPRMHKEPQERRDFLPGLFGRLGRLGGAGRPEILLEKGYGSGMGLTEAEYMAENPSLRFVSYCDVLQCDGVVVVRCPEEDVLRTLSPGSVLFSMLHYETRARRNVLLKELGVVCFSMDGLVDERNNRLLVNYAGTSMAGVRVAFRELKTLAPEKFFRGGAPLMVTVIGMGEVGQKAAKALEICSDETFGPAAEEGAGLVVEMLPRSITEHPERLAVLLEGTDLLVDATRRPDTSKIIVPNVLLGRLPKHAVILDLAADPYDPGAIPPQVKGIEGIPTGTLERMVIGPNDPLYETIPEGVDSRNRRLVVSCNAWPAVDAKECMELYGTQIFPFLRLLVSRDHGDLDPESDDLHERALARATLSFFLSRNDVAAGLECGGASSGCRRKCG